jgi:hypothetical protein
MLLESASEADREGLAGEQTIVLYIIYLFIYLCIYIHTHGGAGKNGGKKRRVWSLSRREMCTNRIE